jgi:tRNA pseudouridine32 synthase / 23S rRNA pseudouridine746 synthase
VSQAREWHLEIKGPEIVLERLARETELSKRALKDVLRKGAVWLTRGKGTRRHRRAKAELRSGDVLHLYYDPAVLAAEPSPARLVADEGDYSVWDKPRGMLSQGSKWGDHCTIGRWSEAHLEPQRSAFVIHRLDRATRGLMVLAHSKGAARALSELFAGRGLAKTYRARVEGHPDADEQTLDEPIEGRSALSRVRVLERHREGDHPGQWAEVEVDIETGRKHQIRRHLSGLGHPIVGDRLYGSGREGGPDLQLSAVRLAFECPLSGAARVYTLE